jgi:hypothetical protein
MPDAGFSIRGSASAARPERKETTGSRVIRPERLMDVFQGKASPNRPALGLPNGSSSVRLKLWRKLWRISLVNRLTAGRAQESCNFLGILTHFWHRKSCNLA